MNSNFDVIIIGAGLSGLAAGIRLAMFDKSVCIFESHSIPGGLNSYYCRGQRKIDVGLHAMTNFVTKNQKGRPLNKLLKQLRIPYDDLKLIQQNESKIVFPDKTLSFNNDLDFFIDNVAKSFPDQISNFENLINHIDSFNEYSLQSTYISAKKEVSKFITNELLLEMIFCPLLIYGSAWEDDMDFSQFVIMFKSIFVEGFSRPQGGIRTIIKLLTDRYEKLGGTIKYKSKVKSILTGQGSLKGIELNSGKIIQTKRVISSVGHLETLNLVDNLKGKKPRPGNLSFTESILTYKRKPKDWDINSTIIFYNNREKYNYRRPDALIDDQSAVICFPNNFQNDDFDEGVVRITNIANYNKWNELDNNQYLSKKQDVLDTSISILKSFAPKCTDQVTFHDTFTPLTIKKFTHHLNGAVYGNIDKTRDGQTGIQGLNICGTDQGFLGIVGSMLSGISMANFHELQS